MGMDEVETAAADTTSEHSSSPRPLHHAHAYQLGHMTTPNYPSNMTGTPLSLSSDHHSQQPTWEARNAQLGRGREFDDSFEFEGGAPPFKRQRMETVGDQSSQMSPETSVHVRRHHGDRPVGIAQPMQLQDTQQTSSPFLPIPSVSKESSLPLLTSKEDIDQLQKQKVPSHSSTPQQKHSTSSSSSSSSSSINPFHSSAQVHSPEQPVATTIPTQQSQSTSGTFGDSSDSTRGSGTQVDLVMPQDSRKIPLNYIDEVYDSDQSQESQRFNKFINESSNKSGGSGSSSMERLTLSDKKQHFESLQESTTSSETSSESTAQFIATYVTPNLKYLDSDACIESSTNQSDAKSVLDSPSHHHDLPPPPPPVETPPGMRVSKEPFDAHVLPPWIESCSDEEETHGHLSAYGVVEKDYSAATSRRRSSSYLPSARPIESEWC